MNNRRRALLNGRLPSAYQEVEYIQNNGDAGTSYINTHLATRPILNVECVAQAVSVANMTAIYGGRSVTDGSGYGNEIMYNTSGKYQVSSGLYSFSTNSWDYLKHTYKMTFSENDLQTAFTIDGVQQGAINYSSFAYQYSIFLFSCNVRGENLTHAGGSLKLYSISFYDYAMMPLGDFVPCYRKSDGEIGMYDLVTNAFFENQGDTAFTKGADI